MLAMDKVHRYQIPIFCGRREDFPHSQNTRVRLEDCSEVC
jgi:hypothetical protein